MCSVVEVKVEIVADVKGKKTNFSHMVRLSIFINDIRFHTDRRVWESFSPSLFKGNAKCSIVELIRVVYFNQVERTLLRYNTIEDK